MSFSGEIRNIADALEAKTRSDTQNLIRSLLNAFPDDLNLTDEDNVLNDPTNNMDLDDQNSGMLTPIKYNSSAASTPSLSLPDSFDVDCFEATKVQLRIPGQFPLRQPEESRCPRCTEVEQSARQEKSQLASKCAELKSSLDASLLKYDATYAELLRLQKISGITEENQRLEIAALTDRCLRLTHLHETETTLRRKYEESANKFDTTDAELQRQKKETAELRATLEQQGKAVQILTQSENAARKASEDSERSKELLALDKSYLQQELRAMESRYNDKCRAAESSHSQSLALEVKVAQLTDQLLTLQLTARTGFDERMDKEVQRLREENSREMEALKATSRDILDRENRVLRETKASLESECQALRLRNDTLSQQLGLAQQESLGAQQDKNSTISELRAEIKMKAFELTTLGVTFEERMGQLRQAEAEVEVLRHEISAHKSAIQRLEGESAQTEHSLRSELAQCTTRLRAYEALEEEIDSAVMRTAGLYGGTDAGDASAHTTEEATQKLLHSVKGIPTNPERRVKQAVYLAQRLLEAERQRDLLQSDIAKLREELVGSKKQAQVAAENLARAAQPTAYLVNKLRDEENSKGAFLAKCKKLEQELQKSRQAEGASRKESEALKERLHSLLQQRGELETVKVMLAQLSALEAQENDYDEGDDASSGDEDEGDTSSGDIDDSPPRNRKVEFRTAREEKRPSPSPSPSTSSHGSSAQQRSAGAGSPAGLTTPTKSATSLLTTAAALGLTPEQMREMTSPPQR